MQNLDRLGSIQKHLSLCPNALGKFALSLGGRWAEFSICFGSPSTMLHKFYAVDEDVEGDQRVAYTRE
jgi:hypothetical protein